ncbi:MAG: hypothetical protein AAFW82_07640 [Pseudomonadota bacterium]
MTESRTIRAMMEAMMAGVAVQEAAEESMKAAARFMEEEKAHGAALADALGATMSRRVDGEGAFYGWWEDGDDSLPVYVYPPKDLWNGDIMPGAPELHETDWQVVVAGKKVAQAAMIKDLPALSALELTGHD